MPPTKQKPSQLRKSSVPHYYRQRFLLKLIELGGGNLGKTKLQKLLFLSQRELDFRDYSFVPHHYGCFSFQADSDVELLKTKGFIERDSYGYKPISNGKILLGSPDLEVLVDIAKKFRSMSKDDVMINVYKAEPYYAIRSKVAEEKLSKKAYGKIAEERSKYNQKSHMVFTIGYEGRSFESYANLLIRNSVRLVCDIRKNPLSRKFGFSKRQFSELLKEVGVAYYHIPDLGIDSSLRQDLNTDSDYKRLFASYKKGLVARKDSLLELYGLIKENGRVALTCFESDPGHCHRHCVSDYLGEKFNLEARHLDD